ncbi:hypothetical protein GCM10007989_01160 [Devosia pacifica]|uniref:UDP-2,3-diacylglucosamine pyrophosphatase n=1 Tax=Devosia pacifica TaxID=1335967 RepID=A0A918VN57_9HYPH|nr:UDP-2,3-diacylglucosamine diphosphatase LpxI [Devosia pacifica]GHA10710.1 hypothetical protein GCM10007989_01160 [Devosia pacifica]
MARRLSILAGSGDLVGQVVEAAKRAGDRIQVLALATRSPIEGTKHVTADIGNPLGILFSLRMFRTTHIVMAGGVVLPDTAREGLLRFANRNTSEKAAAPPERTVGDGALSGIGKTIKTLTGAELIGVQDLCPDLLAPAGHIAGPQLSAQSSEDCRWALSRAREAGRLDLGQALVTCGRRMIAVEDIGGTDDLIRRCGSLKRDGRAGDGRDALILAKAPKPDQPLYIDLPAIGPDTIRNCADAGIGLVVVQAGRSLVIERSSVEAEAVRAGISIVGIELSDD